MLPKKTTYAYLSLFMDCWNIQENLDVDLFWAGDGRFCGIFFIFKWWQSILWNPFSFWRHAIRLATFFIGSKNCIFQGASFEPMKTLATLIPEMLQGFHGTPLYHWYTLAYHYQMCQNTKWLVLLCHDIWCTYYSTIWDAPVMSHYDMFLRIANT